MSQAATIREQRQAFGREAIESPEQLLRQGILKLLAIKDSDVRILTLEQSRDAVDQGPARRRSFLGRDSAGCRVYYGGFIAPDVEDPTRVRQRHVRAQ